jgi:hypothetical protein
MIQIDANDYYDTENTIRKLETKLSEKGVWLDHTHGTPAFNAFERVHWIYKDYLRGKSLTQIPQKTLSVAKEILCVAAEVLNETN